MKYLSLKTAKEKAGSKHALAMNCKISPAAVSKAFNEETKMGYKVRVLNKEEAIAYYESEGIPYDSSEIGPETWHMLHPQAPWHVVTAQKQRAGNRTRNY